MKKIAIIIGYNKLKGIVDNTNIEEVIKENFSGYNLQDKSFDEVINQLYHINKFDIKNIV